MKKTPDERVVRLARSYADLGPAERPEFLDRECGEDHELRREIETAVHDVEGETTQVFANDYEKALPKHYRLIELLGRGGMAEVFLAADQRLGRSVAIKFLNNEFRKDPERMRRFNQEARAASALNHPNILTIHDIGEKDSVQFIVCEFVEGETLGARISRGKILLPEAIDITIQIASALAASHKAGIVHRDMKPDNVMVRRDGSVKVLDFGLAKETGNDYSNMPDFDARTLDRISTAPGLILGTPQYMSPEQARGSHLDARTDIFSFGIILFEMVTGHSPFKGNSIADTIAAIVSKEPRRIEEFIHDPPVTLIRIVEKALRKDKEERYLTMDHLLSDLKDLRRELSEEFAKGRETAGAEARTTFFDHPVQTVLGSRFIRSKWLLVIPVLLIAALTAWWYIGRSRPDATTERGSMRSVPITSWSARARELIAAASFSPDASMVAFAATKSESAEIWVKPTVGGDAIQVTRNGFSNQFPIWSPDGRELAYFSNRGEGNHGIWRASFTGGEQVLVLGGLSVRTRPVYWVSGGRIYFQEGPDLFAVDQRSGERTRLTNFESQGLEPEAIELAADESTIAYSIKEGDLWKVKVKRINTETAEEIGRSKVKIDNLAWHPDNKTVIFSGSVEGFYQIFEASAGGTDPVQLSNGNLDFHVEDVSADGQKILYGTVNETSDIWMVDTHDSKQSLIANEVAAEYWADISPDGKSVAFQSVKQVEKPFRGSINVKPVTGSGASMVVSQEGFSPTWSSNGEWIAFFRWSENRLGIWRVSPTGDDAMKLAEGDLLVLGYTATPYLKLGINHFSWSPNSETIAYSARTDERSNIWLANSDGSQTRRLTDNNDEKEFYRYPTWTPDGKAVVFSSAGRGHRLWLVRLEDAEARAIFESKERFAFLGLDEGGNAAIIAQKDDRANMTATPALTVVYSVPLETGTRQKVNTLSNAYTDNIHLSRDGKSIAFVSNQENVSALWTVPVSGGTPRRLLIENDPKILISSLAWSSDGRSIVFGKQTRTNLLSMLAK